MLALLYALAILVLTLYGVNLLWLAGVRAWGDDPAEDTPGGLERWPEVTVQIPLYNEATVAERVIDACARLRYPRRKLEIQVLDDSTDETSRIVARRVAHWRQRGVDMVHVRRDERTGYKAGALQNGLRLARGELIAVFDADFVPEPDFLERLVPHFADERIGMVQARWGHRNAGASLLTGTQAFGLDGHFALEQHARQQAGCFINFNGTAGLWRRTAIEKAGGWQDDTLTEDLDLSYRAQLAGWKLRYVPEAEVPAELPVTMNALRDQQFRWAKGAIETARKTLGRLWRSGEPLRVRLEGTLHLTAHLAFPALLLAALTHAPLLYLTGTGQGPGPLYFALMSVGFVGFAGFATGLLLAQRALYPDWGRRLWRFPLFMAGTVGLALSNTRAVWQALRGRKTPFVRTPKFLDGQPWWRHRYGAAEVPAVAWGEAALAGYSLVGLGLIAAEGLWVAVPFQTVFALGFALVAATSFQQARRAV